MKKREMIAWVKGRVKFPKVLDSNVYFWKPCRNANGRRENEKAQIESVENFLARYGFSVLRTDRAVIGNSEELEVYCFYSESCKNCYKVLEIKKDGKRVTIRELYYYLYNFHKKIAEVLEVLNV